MARAKRTQRALKTRRLKLSARCNEGCKIVAVAKLRVGRKRVVLGRARTTVASGTKANLKVKLSKKACRRLRTAIKHGKAKVTLTVKAADGAGNKTARTRRVTVKR